MSLPAACPGCDGERTDVFDVEGLDCANEVTLIEGHLRGLEGVCSVRVSGATGRATVVHTRSPEAIVAALRALGFRARTKRDRRAGGAWWHVAVGAALVGAGFVASTLAPSLAVALHLAAVAVGGWAFAPKAARRLARGAIDMHVLMSLAVGGALLIGEWGEAATTAVLFSLAQLIEARSLGRARAAMRALMAEAPDSVVVRRGGREARVPVASVGRGETIVVAPGERVGLDGVVVHGDGEVDQAPLTGESRWVPKSAGDEVLAGSVNGAGVLVATVSRPAAETTLARIIRRVEEAQASRARSQAMVDRFARVYTPAVVSLAGAIALVPPLLGWGGAGEWLYRALVLLVASCPCALVISTPVSLVSALTCASRRGVLVKGGIHLEDLARVRRILFDKTGTLTEGASLLVGAHVTTGRSVADVARLALAVETRSAHPVARALHAYAEEEGLATAPADAVTVLPGRGIRGHVDGSPIHVGSEALMRDLGVPLEGWRKVLDSIERSGHSAVIVSEGDSAVGVLAIGDAVRREARAALDELRDLGLEIGMITGDNALTGVRIAEALGIRDPAAELLPEDKVRIVTEARAAGGVAMVGDGVNDAPALAAATVGIAMGNSGSDAAMETADVVLMTEDLRRLPFLVRLGRATRRTVGVNIGISLGIKGAVVAAGALGLASLWSAVVADMGASLLVVANGLRLLGFERDRLTEERGATRSPAVRRLPADGTGDPA